ncbi:hypothetical protein GGP81_002095 [Salinibacter ruber]|uniref:hypothetical protein n=1 Tax=Salinibacter ruber TaxID=146919 RepID=UPI00216A4002|nr:hypothetical protein [Salinibacter ruber]MCS3955564.1 hypothetical protein [Salinibacter ruber]
MDFEPSRMDLPSLVETALIDDAKGTVARTNLKSRNTELQVQPLLATEVHLTSEMEKLKRLYPRVPEQSSVRGVDLPLQWRPKVEYRVCPSKSGGTVQIKAPGESFGTAKLTLSSDQIGHADTEELSIAVDPYLEISSAWSDVIDTLDQVADDSPLASLSKIQHIRQSAERQEERYAARSQKLLSLARGALLGWIVVTLHGIEKIPVPSREGRNPWLRPSQDYENFDSNNERQRQALSEKFGRYGLFAAEVSKLWEMIYTRTLPPVLQLDAIAKGLHVPESITSAVAHVLELTSSALKEVDEDMTHSQALIGACEAIEGFIIETDNIPR